MSVRHERGAKVEADFDQFVRHHATPVLAYCLRRTAHADAHDAAAEVFSIAWRRFDDVPDGDDALFWLFGVARRVLSNQRRGNRRYQRLARRAGSLGASPPPSADTVVLRHERDREVIDAVHSLSPRDQEVLALIVWDEVPRAQVAALLDISEQAVHKRYQRALRRLERRLSRGSALRDSTRAPDAGGDE